MGMRTCLVLVVAALALAPLAVLAQESQSAQWLFIELAKQADRESDAAARAGHAEDAKTWKAWSRVYGQDSVAPAIEGKSALQITAEEESGVRQLATSAHDPRAAALYRVSADFWHALHEELAGGGPLAINFPKREMLTPVPGLKGTPWQPGIFATAADCAQLAQRVRACEAQAAQMQHENMTGLYGDRSFPLLMQEHSCHRWEQIQVAYCYGR